jgi:hypothetical protein
MCMLNVRPVVDVRMAFLHTAFGAGRRVASTCAPAQPQVAPVLAISCLLHVATDGANE